MESSVLFSGVFDLPWWGYVLAAIGLTHITLMGAANVMLFGIVPGALILVTQIAWIPFWAAGVINGIGHFWGYRNWSTEDASTNIVPWGIIIGGEELHNNHHAYATSAKLSNKWYEIDLGWMYICLLDARRARLAVGALECLPRAARPAATGLVPPRGSERHPSARGILAPAALLRLGRWRPPKKPARPAGFLFRSAPPHFRVGYTALFG